MRDGSCSRGVLLVKSAIWIFSLGSETAGGILAPLLMIGGAMGAALGHFMPTMPTGAWVVVGMTAVLTAAIGSPLTAAMLAVELTHNGGLMLPVLLACVSAYAISVLVQPRSMLTEGLSRRGLHLSREYGVDPMELVLVGQAMHTSVYALASTASRKDAADWLRSMEERGADAWSHWQRLFPLVDGQGKLTTVLTRSQMIRAAKEREQGRALWMDGDPEPRAMSPGQTLRQAATEMAETKLTSFPVVDPGGKLVGIMTIDDLLKATTRATQRERDRVRVLSVRWPFAGRSISATETVAAMDGEQASPAAQAAAQQAAMPQKILREQTEQEPEQV